MSDATPTLPTRAGHFIVYLLLQSLIGLATLMPYRLRVPMMGWLTAYVIAPLAGYRRRIRDNLAHIFPDLPEAEVKRLCRAVPDNAGRTMIEMYSTDAFCARARRAPVSGPGLEPIGQARAEGRPVIFVTGHFGNFNAARVAMVEHGFEMGGLYRPMRNPYFNRRYASVMTALSKPMFEQGRKGVVGMVKHLREGGILGILTDLNAHDGVPLDFMGQPALSSLATAELALKFNAPLVPVWGIREENGLDFRILVEDPIPVSDPVTMTQEVNDRLAAQVRAHMDQWFWIHRRWKDGTGLLADYRAQQLAEKQDG